MSEEARSLDLSYKKLDQKDCEALLQVPFPFLILQGCQLGEQEALILSRSTRIKGLNLGNNSISDVGAKNLATGTCFSSKKTIQSSFFHILSYLHPSHNSVDGSEAKGLASGNLKALIFLNLCNNSIGNEGTQALASGNLGALTSLNLGNNSIGDEGAKGLATGNLAALMSLDLSNKDPLINLGSNRIGYEGVKGLASGNLTALTSLNLWNNSIGEEGKAALKRMSTLKDL